MILGNFLQRFCFAIAAVIFGVMSIVSVSSAAGSFESSYGLGAGDKISIRVFGEDDLSMDTLIGDSGVLSYPLLGDIKVLDLTISELERRIDRGLRGDYLINPSVNVSITQYRPFFIQGEVVSPGAYPFQPSLNVEKAITLARGFTARASKQKVFIVRASDPYQLKKSAKMSDPVHPGDMIVVKESFF